ncbi:MAG: hypothetical protein IE922_06295, partial [Sphingomonadales bacterium]|nr:hypothetical protein [Sphingomonadales bacterium]
MPMERADRIGTGVSAALHVGVIAWAVFGSAWMKPEPSEPVTMTEVSVISEADFAAIMAAAPKASDAPAQPQSAEAVPATPEAPTPEPEVTPEPVPEAPPPSSPRNPPRRSPRLGHRHRLRRLGLHPGAAKDRPGDHPHM